MRVFASILALTFSAAGAYGQINDSTLAEVKRMDWSSGARVDLQASQSLVLKLPDYLVVIGQDARRIREISDGTADKSVEAYAYKNKGSGEVIFGWFPAGFVRAEDWADIDSANFLAQIKENDAAANKLRVAKGIPTLTTQGWRQEPRFNKDTSTASWIIEARDGSGSLITNSVALKLGRSGFEKITWIDDADSPTSASEFARVQDAHQFGTGARYMDYVPGADRAAEYGIAGLVAGALGVKVAKAAGFIGALVVLKKFAALLLLPFIWLATKLKNVFRRERPNALS
jgi:uncharacterized membrane-anchored protein